MANQLIGKVIAVSQIEKVASSTPGKEPFEKRSLYMDCTKYDAITGERGFENTPLLEFGGKAIEKLNALVDAGLKKDDIVVVSFDVQGSKYTKEGKTNVFTRIRPYDIELFKPQKQEPAPAQVAAPPTAAPQEEQLPF